MDLYEASREITQMSKPIKWLVPDSIRTDHATHLVVQQQGSEFTLLFFELQAPIITGTLEEQVAAYKELPFTEAKCISKIVMSAENMTVATNNLIEVLNRFTAVLQANAKGQEDASIPEHSELPTTS